MFSFGGSAITGLEIGASAVKIVQGSLSASTFSMSNLSIVPVAARAMDERGIVDREAVSQSLGAAIESLGSKCSKVATAMKGLGVITKKVTIPKIPKKEIPDQVQWEAEQVFPMDVSSIVTDYVLLGEGAQVPGAPPGTTGWDLLLVGVRVEEINVFKDVIVDHSLDLKVIDLDAFVVASFLDKVMKPAKDSVVAYVDIGASTTRVFVSHRGHVIFIREFISAGNTFTDAVAQRLGLSFEDAEAIKTQDAESMPQEARDAIRAQVQVWKNELQQSEDIFVAQESDRLISHWCFIGGGTLTPMLLDSLKDDRFGPKLMEVPYERIFKAKGKNVDQEIMQSWAPRLVTAAALASRRAS